MPYCSSCGSYIPEGQGRSCSMCYGDISYGRDSYYLEWAQEQDRIASEKYRYERGDDNYPDREG